MRVKWEKERKVEKIWLIGVMMSEYGDYWWKNRVGTMQREVEKPNILITRCLTRVVSRDTGVRVRVLFSTQCFTRADTCHVSLLETSLLLLGMSWHWHPCKDPVFLQKNCIVWLVSPCSSSILYSLGWVQTSPSVLCDYCVNLQKTRNTPKQRKLLELNSVGFLPRSTSFNVAWLDGRLSYPLRRTLSINPLSCPL